MEGDVEAIMKKHQGKLMQPIHVKKRRGNSKEKSVTFEDDLEDSEDDITGASAGKSAGTKSNGGDQMDGCAPSRIFKGSLDAEVPKKRAVSGASTGSRVVSGEKKMIWK